MNILEPGLYAVAIVAIEPNPDQSFSFTFTQIGDLADADWRDSGTTPAGAD